MNANNPSNATINGFAAGHKVMSTTLDGVSYVTTHTKDACVGSTHAVTGFFGGMKYAIAERRGNKVAPKVSDDAKRRAREELYRRAHSTQNEETTPRGVIDLSHEG